MPPDHDPLESSAEGARFRASIAAKIATAAVPVKPSLQSDVVRGVRWAALATIAGLIAVVAIRTWQGVPIGAAEPSRDNGIAPGGSKNLNDPAPDGGTARQPQSSPAPSTTPRRLPEPSRRSARSALAEQKPEPQLYPPSARLEPIDPVGPTATPLSNAGSPAIRAQEPQRAPASSFVAASSVDSGVSAQAGPPSDGTANGNPMVRGIKSVGRVFGLGRKKDAKSSDSDGKPDVVEK